MYKRQPFDGVAQKNGLISVVEDALEITDALAFCSTGPSRPVSYTHLDVYKRQSTYRVHVFLPGSSHPTTPSIRMVNQLE